LKSNLVCEGELGSKSSKTGSAAADAKSSKAEDVDTENAASGAKSGKKEDDERLLKYYAKSTKAKSYKGTSYYAKSCKSGKSNKSGRTCSGSTGSNEVASAGFNEDPPAVKCRNPRPLCDFSAGKVSRPADRPGVCGVGLRGACDSSSSTVPGATLPTHVTHFGCRIGSLNPPPTITSKSGKTGGGDAGGLEGSGKSGKTGGGDVSGAFTASGKSGKTGGGDDVDDVDPADAGTSGKVSLRCLRVRREGPPILANF
ncbi:hypothetical protein THAOC_27849, partial [Thalassiosira oceanica]